MFYNKSIDDEITEICEAETVIGPVNTISRFYIHCSVNHYNCFKK